MVTAWRVSAPLRGLELPELPAETMTGSLLRGFLFDTTTDRLAPMNVNFGLVPDLREPVRGKRERKLAKAARSLAACRAWLDSAGVAGLLAAAPER